jgi:hypothetical protein
MTVRLREGEVRDKPEMKRANHPGGAADRSGGVRDNPMISSAG